MAYKRRSPIPVTEGGTSAQTLTTHGVLLGEGTSAITATSAGTNGQVLIGSTGADPAFATLTSTDSSITYTTGAHSLDLAVAGKFADTFNGDTGSAIPTLGILALSGGNNIHTSATGATVTFNVSGTTNHAVQVGASTGALTSVSPSATSGVPLISQGSSADPVFGTAVVAGGGTGDTSFTAYAVICGGTTTTGALQSIASVGSSGNVLTSNGAGALPTFQAPAGGFAWTEVTAATVALAVNNGYIMNRATAITATLPATAAQGSIIQLVGKGAGLSIIAQNSGQTIHFGNQNTTTGVSGSLTATNQYDAIELLCITANTDFSVVASQGNWTVV